MTALGEQYSQCSSPLEAGVEGDAPSILLWMDRMNMGVGPKIGADLCAYNKVEKIILTRVLLKERPEYIWMKKYTFSKPLGWRVRPKRIFKLEKLLLNVCMR